MVIKPWIRTEEEFREEVLRTDVNVNRVIRTAIEDGVAFSMLAQKEVHI